MRLINYPWGMHICDNDEKKLNWFYNVVYMVSDVIIGYILFRAGETRFRPCVKPVTRITTQEVTVLAVMRLKLWQRVWLGEHERIWLCPGEETVSNGLVES